jgi:Zn-dependent peptidase ImmA (M78 family)/transcriptional regulator with XRE-family HTH domain
MREAPKGFTGSRLRLARQRRGLSQVELGELVRVSHAFIGYLEVGHKLPSSLLLWALADALEVEPAFFTFPFPEEFRDEECHFRRRQTTPVGVRTQVLAHATLFGELVAYLENFLELPDQHLPSIRVTSVEQVERAAEQCRLHYQLGADVPVTNTTRVLEGAGVPVTRFEGLSDKVDAFSRFGHRSLVVLNDKSASRSRWDMAHELGHLVMHGGAATGTLEAEQQANRFAAAFLLPRAAFVREFEPPRRWTWEPLFRLKARWRVSLAAIVRRAFDLDLIDALQYRQAYKGLSAKGWLRHEPQEFAAEKPELVSFALAALPQMGVHVQDLCRDLGWRMSLFTAITGEQLPEQPSTLRANVVKLGAARRRRTLPR